MSLLESAKYELELAGLFDKDSDYNGMIGDSVMELLEVFCKQGHSGFSAKMVIDILDKLLNGKTLTEFIPSIDQAHNIDGAETWQSTRRGDVFSVNNGKTWYSIDTDEKW